MVFDILTRRVVYHSLFWLALFLLLLILDATSQNMNEFSRELRNNPGVVLGSKPPADAHGNQ
jgi:hypothetical protein